MNVLPDLDPFEEEMFTHFQDWLIQHLDVFAKPDTDTKQHFSDVCKRLKHTTLWDVEEGLEYFFSYKIRGYKDTDVATLIYPILRKWTRLLRNIAEHKLQIDANGTMLASYYNAQEIKPIDGLYLGSRLAGHDFYWLKSQGVTHILTAAVNLSPLYPQDFEYKLIEVWDTEHVELCDYFDSVIKWIDNALQSGKVLVHWLVSSIPQSQYVTQCELVMQEYPEAQHSYARI